MISNDLSNLILNKATSIIYTMKNSRVACLNSKINITILNFKMKAPKEKD